MHRRQALRAMSLGVSGMLLAGCQFQLPNIGANSPGKPSVTDTPAVATATSASQSTSTPIDTATPAPTPIPPTATLSPHSAVAIGKADSYDPALLRSQLQAMFDGLGGLKDIIPSGARIGIKVNLTGGTYWQKPKESPATEVFVTHPAVVGALCELLLDSGAKQISVVEAVYEPESWTMWGYGDLTKKYGVRLVNLNNAKPYKGFSIMAVKGQRQIYDTFTLSPVLQELDTFISVAKLKVHYTAGVTLTMKNLVGITPLGLYRKFEEDTSRSSLHGGFQDGVDRHLIRSILDLNQARPIHLGIIDGVMTCEGGEGPWEKINQVKAGVLIAGKDPLATDAVATAVMGFDPEAATLATPFVRSENYLSMAHDIGLGTHHLSEIPIIGASIDEVKHTFRDAT